MKLTDLKFKKLLKKYKPQKIINLHIMGKIDLTSKQLDELINLRDKKERRDSNEENKKSKTKRNRNSSTASNE